MAFSLPSFLFFWLIMFLNPSQSPWFPSSLLTVFLSILHRQLVQDALESRVTASTENKIWRMFFSLESQTDPSVTALGCKTGFKARRVYTDFRAIAPHIVQVERRVKYIWYWSDTDTDCTRYWYRLCSILILIVLNISFVERLEDGFPGQWCLDDADIVSPVGYWCDYDGSGRCVPNDSSTLKAYRHRSKIIILIGSQDVYQCSQKKWYRIPQRQKSYLGAKLVMFRWSLRAENDLDIAKYVMSRIAIRSSCPLILSIATLEHCRLDCYVHHVY